MSDDSKHIIESALPKWVEKKKYLNKSATENSVARSFHVSTLELREYLQREHKADFRKWIERLKAEEAKRIMFENPSMSYSEVASLLGYDTQHAFTVAFSLSAGVSPGYWKNKHVPKDNAQKRSAKPVNIADAAQRKTTPKAIIPFDINPITQWKRGKGFCHVDITLESVAKTVGYSTVRLKQYVQHVEGISFQDWVAKLKIEEAKRLLLLYPGIGIREIAKMVGYPSVVSFRNSFKKIVNCTPLEWRKNRQPGNE